MRFVSGRMSRIVEVPVTTNFVLGVDEPIPTYPPVVILITSVPDVSKARSCTSFVPNVARVPKELPF